MTPENTAQANPNVEKPKPGEVVRPSRMNDEQKFTPTPFPNPFIPPKEVTPRPEFKLPPEVQENLAKIPAIGEKVIKSNRFRKIFFVSFLGLVLLVSALTTWFYFGPPWAIQKDENTYVPPIVSEPVIKEPPKPDRTSLRFLDSQIRELNPVINKLNDDSLFIIKLNLGQADFYKINL